VGVSKRPDGVGENLNTGIAIATRIDRVLDLINSPSQVALREELKKRIEAEEGVEAAQSPAPD
jgi:hypothetical protein